jgi:signal transduction histidine kinase
MNERTLLARCTLRFRRGVFFFKRVFIIPRSINEDVARREYILNVILISSVGISAVAAVVSVFLLLKFGPAYGGIPPVFIFGIFVTFCTLLLFSRLGYTRISSLVLIGLYLFPIFYASIMWGADLPEAVAVYGFLIIMFSVLVSARMSVLFAVFLCFFLYGVTAFHNSSASDAYHYWRDLPFSTGDAVAMMATFGATAAVSWLSSNEIAKSLYRARASERALKEERDLLEVKVEERTQDLRKAQLEQMSQLHRFIEFGRLASGLFHDISSPLSALSINLRMLENEKSFKDTEEHLVSALKTTDKLQDFLLSIRRQLQTSATKTTFTVRDELEKVIELLAYKARSHEITLEVLCPENPEIYVDIIKFDQVVMNLVTNAIDACKDSSNKDKKVSVRGFLRGKDFELEVDDNGCGIPEDIGQKMFDPFFTTKAREGGIGIGLATCKTIIESDFQGKIMFVSAPGQGTLFTVRFPQYVLQEKPS